MRKLGIGVIDLVVNAPTSRLFARAMNAILVAMGERLADDHVRRYWQGETTEIPLFYDDWIKRDLGSLCGVAPRRSLASQMLVSNQSKNRLSRVRLQRRSNPKTLLILT